jgi:bifunctional UDP-N-acetylglucosamine pyrophosphorylase/glucosamine-1-phosphate N-acetyltransferase
MSTAVILAAGLGTRMRSALPKAMHPLAGQPMLRHLLASAEAVFDTIVVVVGPDMPALADQAAPHAVVVQQQRLGTGHAALQAAAQFGRGNVAVLYADNPLITPDTLRRLLAARRDCDLAMLAMRPPEPQRYGRVIVVAGRVTRIVEFTEATEAERAVGLCNAGVFCAAAADLAAWLHRLTPAANGEYYLTDIVPHATCARAIEAPYEELRGINTRAELAEAEATVQQRLRRRAMDAGVSLLAPETVFLSFDTEIGPDTTIAPYVICGTGVRIGDGCEIRAFTHLDSCIVQAGATVGPFARLRPGTVIGANAHVGNFVELKAATLGAGAKANHLSYLGDASIGANTNIGAGTITCNYDGVSKHRTTIGADVFVGSNTTLVAPMTIGDGAFIAAGSAITDPVEADALAFGRARQQTKPGMGKRLRRWLRERA